MATPRHDVDFGDLRSPPVFTDPSDRFSTYSGGKEEGVAGLAAPLVVLIAASTVLFCCLEWWDPVESFYFTCITLSTIAYGDVLPSSPLSKFCACVLSLCGIGLFGAVVVDVGQWRRQWVERKVAAHQTALASVLPRPLFALLSLSWPVTLSIALFIQSLAIGSVGMYFLEGMPIADGLYFSFVTVCGIGFGDLHAATPLGRLFVAAYILYCTGVAVLVLHAGKDAVMFLWSRAQRLWLPP